jgi:hypothetical protein
MAGVAVWEDELGMLIEACGVGSRVSACSGDASGVASGGNSGGSGESSGASLVDYVRFCTMADEMESLAGGPGGLVARAQVGLSVRPRSSINRCVPRSRVHTSAWYACVAHIRACRCEDIFGCECNVFGLPVKRNAVVDRFRSP